MDHNLADLGDRYRRAERTCSCAPLVTRWRVFQRRKASPDSSHRRAGSACFVGPPSFSFVFFVGLFFLVVCWRTVTHIISPVAEKEHNAK